MAGVVFQSYEIYKISFVITFAISKVGTTYSGPEIKHKNIFSMITACSIVVLKLKEHVIIEVEP